MTDDETYPFKIPNLFFSDFNCRVDRLEQKTRCGYQRFMKPRRLIGRQLPLFTRSIKIDGVYGIVNIRIATDKENPTISRGLKGQPPIEFESLPQFQQVLQQSVLKTHLKHTYNPDPVIIIPTSINEEVVKKEEEDKNEDGDISNDKKKKKKNKEKDKPKPKSSKEIKEEISLLLSHVVTQIEDIELAAATKLKEEEEAKLKEIEEKNKIIEIEDDNSPSELVVPNILQEIIEDISIKNDFIISTEISYILNQLVAEVANLTPPKPFTRVYPTILNTIIDNKNNNNNVPIYCHSYIGFERKRKLKLAQDIIIKLAKEEEQMKLDQIQFEIMEAKINWYNDELSFIEEERRLLREEEDKNRKIWMLDNPENIWNFYEKPIFPGDVDKADVFNCLTAVIDIVSIPEDLIGIMNELIIDVELNIESEKEMAALMAQLEADEKQEKERNEKELKEQKALAKKKRREENSDSDYSESESDNESEMNENTDDNTNENSDIDEIELSRIEDKTEEEEHREISIDKGGNEDDKNKEKMDGDNNKGNSNDNVVSNSDSDEILPDHADDNDNIENIEYIVPEVSISNNDSNDGNDTQEGGDDDDTYTDTDIDRSALQSRQSVRTTATDATDYSDDDDDDDDTTIGTKSRPGTADTSYTADTDSLTVGDDDNILPLQSKLKDVNPILELDEDGNPIPVNTEETEQEQVHINYFEDDEDDDLLGLGEGAQYENDENELQNKAYFKYANGAEVEIEIYVPTDSIVLDGYVIPSTTIYRGRLNKDDLLKIIPDKEIIFSGLRAAYEEFYKEEYNLEHFLEIMKVWEYLGDEILSKSKWMLQYPVEEGDNLYEGLLEKVHKVDILTNKVIKNIKPVEKDINIYPAIPDIVLSWSLIFFNSYVKVRSKSEFRKVVKLQIVLYQDNDTFGIIAYDREIKDIYFLDCPTEVCIIN
jgi:hypothetical protein